MHALCASTTSLHRAWPSSLVGSSPERRKHSSRADLVLGQAQHLGGAEGERSGKTGRRRGGGEEEKGGQRCRGQSGGGVTNAELIAELIARLSSSECAGAQGKPQHLVSGELHHVPLETRHARLDPLGVERILELFARLHRASCGRVGGRSRRVHCVGCAVGARGGDGRGGRGGPRWVGICELAMRREGVGLTRTRTSLRYPWCWRRSSW